MARKRPFPIGSGDPADDDTTVYKIYGDLFNSNQLVIGETVHLNAEGIQVISSLDGNWNDQNAYKFIDDDGEAIGGLFGRDDTGQNLISVRAVDPPANGEDVYLDLSATAEPSGDSDATAEVNIAAKRTGELSDTYISLLVDASSSEVTLWSDLSSGRVRIAPKINFVGSSFEQCDVYIKGTYFIIKYNDSGTTRYKYCDLSGTGSTWTHSTTEP